MVAQPQDREKRLGLLAALVFGICLFLWSHRHSPLTTAIFEQAAATATAAAVGGSTTAALPAVEEVIAKSEASYYRNWIEHDLSVWNETGITQQMVDHAFNLAHVCDAGILRFQIVDGALWAHPSAEPPPGGYDPMKWGRGWISAKGRVALVILSIMEALHLFPGQIPDVDFVFHLGDYPCITERGTGFNGRSSTPPWIKDPGDKQKAAEQAAAAGFTTEAQAAAAASPPIFSFNSRRGYRDIPWPCFTFWGHEMGILNDGKGNWLYGWDAQLNHYLNKYANLSLANRWPQLIWRGRYYDPRDALRKMFVDCGKYLGDKEGLDAGVLNLWENWGFPGVNLENICHWRYVGYLESHAYSSNFKQKMACGSVLVTPVLEYYEFFSRALRPAVHYLELSAKAGEMCEDIHRNVKAMNGWLKEQQQQQEQQQERTSKEQEEVKAAAEAEDEGSSSKGTGTQEETKGSKSAGSGEGVDKGAAATAAADKGQENQDKPEQQQEGGSSEGPKENTSRRRSTREGAESGAGAGPSMLGGDPWSQVPQRRRRLDEGIYGSPTPKAKERYSNPWDSDLTPLEVANNGRQFVVDHLRMRDVRLYIRDLLQHYAKLQRFKPTPQPGSKQYTGLKLLNNIAVQYKADAYHIAAQYPWIPYFGCKTSECKDAVL